MRRIDVCRLAVALLVLLALPARSFAQGDEIQVYDAGLAPVGVFNLTWHNNFTPKGNSQQAFPGAIVSDKSFNGVTEWAYGFTPWFEGGLYLPLYTHDKNAGWEIDGFKLRTLFAVPNAGDRRFVYGLGFELGFNNKKWDPDRVTSEFRPIVGWHLNNVDVIFNPILDTSYDGIKNMVFAPSTRVAYNMPSGWAVSIEEYAEYGPLNGFAPAGQQSHQLFGVVNKTFGGTEMEAGIGVGLNDSSDKVALKLMFARDLFKR